MKIKIALIVFLLLPFAALADGLLRTLAQGNKQNVEERLQKQKAEAEMKSGKVFQDCPEMVVIQAGSFDMGGNMFDREKPVHHVTISRAFSMGITEVTQGQWRAMMGINPSYFSKCGDNCPVEKVSWSDAQEFIQRLNSKTGKKYRLPSEEIKSNLVYGRSLA